MRFLAIILACAALAGTPAPAFAKDSLVPQIQAGKDIVIKSVRVVIPSVSNQAGGGPNANWYIIKFAFTNTTAYDFVPQFNKFMFQTPDDVVTAVWTGSPDLIGIENPHQNDLLKVGETYEYTLAFLLNQQIAGYLFYNPV